MKEELMEGERGEEESGKSQGSVVFLLDGIGPASQLAGLSSSVCF